MNNILKILIFTSLIFFTSDIQAKIGILDMTKRINDIVEIRYKCISIKECDEASVALIKEFEKFNYQGAFKKKKLRKYGSQDINIIQKFWLYAFFQSNDDEKLDIGRNIFNELEKRGEVENKQIKDFYDALIKMRKFKEAEKIYKEYSGITIVEKLRYRGGEEIFIHESKLEKMPKVKTNKKAMSAKRRIYHVSSDAGEITIEGVDIEKGPRIIVIGRCHFSDDALRAIGKNVKLSKIFRKYGVFLANGSDFKGIAKWNSSEVFKYTPIHLLEDWQGFDLSSFPPFYFLKDGKIVHSFTGWPKKGNFDEIYKGLGILGLGEVK